jgi:hypothetical protein
MDAETCRSLRIKQRSDLTQCIVLVSYTQYSVLFILHNNSTIFFPHYATVALWSRCVNKPNTRDKHVSLNTLNSLHLWRKIRIHITRKLRSDLPSFGYWAVTQPVTQQVTLVLPSQVKAAVAENSHTTGVDVNAWRCWRIGIYIPFILIFKSVNSPGQLKNKGNAYRWDVCNALHHL